VITTGTIIVTGSGVIAGRSEKVSVTVGTVNDVERTDIAVDEQVP
jgi:hypothetical protein